MDKETKEEFENLARMIAEGFGGADKRFDRVEGRLEGVEAKLGNLEQGQEDIKLRLDQVPTALSYKP